MPTFKIEVGIRGICRIMHARHRQKSIGIRCRRTLRGHRVKILTVSYGRLYLCEVAVYGKYG